MQPIGKLIRQWRGDRSQSTIAGILGISQTYVSDLENGVKEPGKHLAIKLSELTGYPLEAFIRSEKAS
jgi:transcriptional regulator with XRE-family HTH domain